MNELFGKIRNNRASKQKLNIKVFAHNFKGYDGRFILKDLFSPKYSEDPQIIMTGNKILKTDIDRIRFQDSLPLLNGALKQIPGAFGFSSHVKKGYFPFFFNNPGNENYIGPLPPIEDYGYKTMKPEAQKELKERYDSASADQIFDTKKDIESYCSDDVEILLIIVQKFCEAFNAMTRLDPITRNFTLPSIAMEYFRAESLIKDTIGITVVKPYASKRMSSNIADLYFLWLEDAVLRTGRQFVFEKRIGPYFVDAFDPRECKIYEFPGCTGSCRRRIRNNPRFAT